MSSFISFIIFHLCTILGTIMIITVRNVRVFYINYNKMRLVSDPDSLRPLENDLDPLRTVDNDMDKTISDPPP